MTVPRENRLVRLYVQLDETSDDEPFDGGKLTLEEIAEHTREIFEPYRMDFAVCNWHSVYTGSSCQWFARRRIASKGH